LYSQTDYWKTDNDKSFLKEQYLSNLLKGTNSEWFIIFILCEGLAKKNS